MKLKFCITAMALMILCGCSSKGLDKDLKTGEGKEAFGASLNEALKDMSQEEKEAFAWAVSDLNLDSLHQKYPNASPREIIRGEVKMVQEAAPKKLKELEEEKLKYDPILADLKNIKAQSIEFSLPKDFHGLQPTINATITNNSKFAVSFLQWFAELYVDGKAAPVATAELSDAYNNSNGLNPGASVKRSFTVGFVVGDSRWTTLEIQNAKNRVVKLTIIPESVRDFSDKYYLGGAPYEEIERLNLALKLAKKYEGI